MNSNELKNLREFVDASPVCQLKSEKVYESTRKQADRLGLRVSHGMALEAATEALCACQKTVSTLDEEAKKKPGQPSIQTMYKWMSDGVAKATDGCKVEPDGHCGHGKPSWLLELGLI